jgi:methylase of polypeptide subunit release factors
LRDKILDTKLSDAALTPERKKSLGAFYTDAAVVDFLIGWVLRYPRVRVMDPACGDGRFLEALGSKGVKQVIGCDLSAGAIAQAERRLATLPCAPDLVVADFFTLAPDHIPPVDAVVGNPPFVRYQRFDDGSRRLALASALRMGVRLVRSTST